MWAPFATVLAAYGPLYPPDEGRRTAFPALAPMTLIVAAAVAAVGAVITLGVLRTAVGPLLALYFDARRRLLQALHRARRAGRAGAAPARRAGPRRGTRPAGRRDARCRDPPGEPDGAAGRRAAASPRPTRPPGRRRRSSARRAARRWTSCATWSASCAPSPRRPAPVAAGLAALVAESTAVGTPGRAGRGGRPGARLPGGRAHGLPHRAGGADERAQARARRAGDGPGQLRRGAGPGLGPQHRATGPPAAAWPATGSGLGLASLRQRIELVHGTLRAGPHAGRRVPRRGHAARVRTHGRTGGVTGGQGGRGRRRADGVRAPAHDPRLGRRHRGRGRGARRRGRASRRSCAAGRTWC